MWRPIRYTLAGLFAFLLLALGAGTLYLTWGRGLTPPIPGTHSVASLEEVDLNGARQ